MIGRDEVLTEVAALVRTHQLVTLSGVGGVGKTRLAVSAAAALEHEFPDGVWLVELAPVGDADAVPDAIANALGITPQGDTAVVDTVAEAVAGRRLLIVIDNCEHVLAAAVAAIGQVLARSDMPRIMATSREGLLVAGEAVASVAPLALDGGVTSDAVTLFVERAGTARPGFGIFDEHDRSGGGRDLRDARRPAPRHRAGRGPHGRDERGRGAGPARRSVPAADRT